VWSWGSGESGQLGNGRKTCRDQPERCVSSDVTSELFTDVACGTAHALALTESGNLFVWGLNAKGQLGLGDYTSRAAPTEMELPNGHEIAKIYASDHSSAAITRTGQNLLTWGSGKDYRLMHRDEENLTAPTLVERFRDILIAQFCFAQKQSLALAHTRLTKVHHQPSPSSSDLFPAALLTDLSDLWASEVVQLFRTLWVWVLGLGYDCCSLHQERR
jgi:alpha-tubulin suppressor-like RCC1 family protein